MEIAMQPPKRITIDPEKYLREQEEEARRLMRRAQRLARRERETADLSQAIDRIIEVLARHHEPDTFCLDRHTGTFVPIYKKPRDEPLHKMLRHLLLRRHALSQPPPLPLGQLVPLV